MQEIQTNAANRVMQNAIRKSPNTKVKIEPEDDADRIESMPIVSNCVTQSTARKQPNRVDSINQSVPTKKVKKELLDGAHGPIVSNCVTRSTALKQPTRLAIKITPIPTKKMKISSDAHTEASQFELEANALPNKASIVKIRLSRRTAKDMLNFSNKMALDSSKSTAIASIYVGKSPKRKMNVKLVADAPQHHVPTVTIRVIRCAARRNSATKHLNWRNGIIP